MSQVLKPKKGYKLVKGLFGKYEEIPEEWEVEKIEDVFDFITTATNSRSDLETSGDIQYIHYGDIHTKWKGSIDCDSEEIPWISKDKVEKIPLLKEGDLIIADASEDYEGSGASILLKNVKNKKIVSGLHTIVLRNKDESISLDFRSYVMSIKFVKSQIIGYVTGISVYGLSKKNLKKIKLPLPLLQEQQKISSILSNIDNLITNTQKMINQTKFLKKGLMQKLLTEGIGHTKFKKTRLGKLPEEWKIKKIRDFCLIIDTPHYTSPNSNNGIPVIRTSDCKTNGRIDYSKTKFISELEYEKRRVHIDPEKGDILFTREAPCGIAVLVDKKEIAVGQRIILLKTDSKQV